MLPRVSYGDGDGQFAATTPAVLPSYPHREQAPAQQDGRGAAGPFTGVDYLTPTAAPQGGPAGTLDAALRCRHSGQPLKVPCVADDGWSYESAHAYGRVSAYSRAIFSPQLANASSAYQRFLRDYDGARLHRALVAATADPLTHSPMQRPVVLSEGTCVDASTVEHLLATYPETSPVTGRAFAAHGEAGRPHRALQQVGAQLEGTAPLPYDALLPLVPTGLAARPAAAPGTETVGESAALKLPRCCCYKKKGYHGALLGGMATVTTVVNIFCGSFPTPLPLGTCLALTILGLPLTGLSLGSAADGCLWFVDWYDIWRDHRELQNKRQMSATANLSGGAGPELAPAAQEMQRHAGF